MRWRRPRDYRGVTGDITMDDKRNATKPAVVLRVGKGGKYESPPHPAEGMKESNPAEAPRANPDQPKKTEGNTAPNRRPARPDAHPGAGTRRDDLRPERRHHRQRQGVPAGEHPKKYSRDPFLQHVVHGVSLGSIYALIALGYTMVYGVLKLINFAHGDVFMLGR